MIKEFTNVALNVNEEGYLIDFSEWTREIGELIAEEHGISMTDEHWEVIEYIQQQVANNQPLSIRGIKKSGIIDIKKFYELFPGGPLKVSTKIAGVPKPKSCI